MLANFSSSSNDSLLHGNLSFVNSDLPMCIGCLFSGPGSFIYITYRTACTLLLLPLSIFVVYHGLQQWRLGISTSSAATVGRSGGFAYSMVAMEIIGVFGSVLVICGVCSHHFNIFLVGYFVVSFNFYGEMFFHVLACVERCLAVVHPITYLSLRKERGIRIRNISITCVWLLCFTMTILLMKENVLLIVYSCLLISSVVIISFCSVSVLCVLIGPGPGEQGGGRMRVDQSKLRAFYTIMVILGVLMLRFSWNLALSALYLLDGGSQCMIISSGVWFYLPSALVLPLLFLHRTGKLVCWKKNIH